MCRSASLFTFCIQGWQGKLPCMLYSAGTDQDYPTIIFAHGFPGHEKNAALASAIAKSRLSCSDLLLWRLMGQ